MLLASLALAYAVPHPVQLSSLALAPEARPFMRYPDIHGSRIVFTSEGDLWLGDLKSGQAHRITSDPGVERNAAFSPDGTQIAFEAEYDGMRQAYVMPTDGGAPKRLTSVENFRAVTGWSKDGRDIVFRKSGTPTNYAYFKIPAKGGAPTRMPLEFASHIDLGVGDEYVFTRFNRWSTAWFNYAGGMQNQIWRHTTTTRPGGPQFKQLTNVPGTNEYPVWCGDRVYFVNEQKAKFTLMSIPADGGGVRTEIAASPFEIRELSTDGVHVIFESGNTVQVFDPASRTASQVDMTLESDLIHTRPVSIPAEKNAASSSLSPTGKRVLVESRGQILNLPVGDGDARVWKSKPGARLRYPSMSPDTKKVAYISDETGEAQVCLANADGTGEKILTKDGERQLHGTKFSPDSKWIGFSDSKMNLRLVNAETGEEKTVANVPLTWGPHNFEFSPDSKWVVFQNVIPGTLFTDVELCEIATGKVTRVSDGRSVDSYPAFSSDGKYVVFVSGRSIAVASDPVLNQLNVGPTDVVCLLPLAADADDPYAPKDPDEAPAKKDDKKADAKPETKIDLNGLYGRRIELAITSPTPITKVAMLGNRVIFANGAVNFFDVPSGATGVLGAGPSFTVAADNAHLLLPGLNVVTVGGDDKKTANFGGLRLQVDPKAEWKQIFWDSWRLLRDYFYTSNMHGVDWKAVGAKYSAMLPSVRSRDELDELMRWMQAEIGSSHEYLNPGDTQDTKARLTSGYLGIDVEPTASGFYKISKIYRGDGFRTTERSPLLGVGKSVTEGMYLIEVAGTPAKVGEDVFGGLVGRAGRIVSVKVNSKPSAEGATTLLVKPVASEARMRYLSWVEGNRQYVEKASGGRIGYIHMAAMGTGDMNDFIKQFFAQRDKDAIVMDDRFNNGGFVQEYVNRILGASLTGFFNMRDSSLAWSRQQDFFIGPVACLINEFDISCGEEFPHRFRDLKRGPLIGRRTMGGEVGSDPGWPLIDGGVINVPNYGMWTPKNGWAIEGAGVSPDIDVPSDPNAFVEGRDPQLDKAIEWLQAELKKNPPQKMVQPPARNRVNGG